MANDRAQPLEREPKPAEVWAIVREWPLIGAELAVVDAEVRLAVNSEDELAWQAHRHAERRVLAVRELGRPAARRGRRARGVAA
jgi:hypothetical protein